MNAIHSLRYLVTAGVWAACAATAVYWGLRLTSGTLPVPPQAYAGGADAVLRGDAGRLLGAVAASGAEAAPTPGLESRFKLIGVVASTVSPTAGGLALIALDDKPARAYRIGAAIDSGMVLQAVQSREVRIGMLGGPASVVLTLQGLPPAATGTLPSAQSTGGEVPVALVTAPPAAPVVAPPMEQDATGEPGAENVAAPAQPPQMPAAVPAQDGIPISSLPRPRRPPVR